jgi:hypothetical protein
VICGICPEEGNEKLLGYFARKSKKERPFKREEGNTEMNI